MNIEIPVLLGLLITLGSCSELPAEYWAHFPDAQLIQNLGKQGSKGGWRAIHYAARGDKTLTVEGIKIFAEKSGWKFVSDKGISPEQIRKWISPLGKPVFPLGYDGFAPGKNDETNERFPLW